MSRERIVQIVQVGFTVKGDAGRERETKWNLKDFAS